jgi:hypothetical protein
LPRPGEFEDLQRLAAEVESGDVVLVSAVTLNTSRDS